MVFSSSNLLSLQAAVAAGFAVAAIMRSSNSQGFRELSREDGFPEMPEVNVTLNLPKGARSDAGARLAAHMAEQLRHDRGLAKPAKAT